MQGGSLPTQLSSLAALLDDQAGRYRSLEIDDLLDGGRRSVEAVERLVCRLYGVPDALTELVVASAVVRSGTVAQSEV